MTQIATIEKFNDDGTVNVRDNDDGGLFRCRLELLAEFPDGKHVNLQITHIETLEPPRH